MRAKRRPWSDEEIAHLHAAYAGKVDLDALSVALGRDKTGICRKARSLGLTNRRRIRKATEEAIESTVEAMEPAPVVALNPCGEPVQVGYFTAGGKQYPEHRPCVLGMDHGGGCEA